MGRKEEVEEEEEKKNKNENKSSNNNNTMNTSLLKKNTHNVYYSPTLNARTSNAQWTKENSRETHSENRVNMFERKQRIKHKMHSLCRNASSV